MGHEELLKQALQGRAFQDQLNVMSLAYYDPDGFSEFCELEGIYASTQIDWTQTELRKLTEYQPCLGLPRLPRGQFDVAVVEHWGAYRYSPTCTDAFWHAHVEPLGFSRHRVVNIFLTNFPVLAVSNILHEFLLSHPKFKGGKTERLAWADSLRALSMLRDLKQDGQRSPASLTQRARVRYKPISDSYWDLCRRDHYLKAGVDMRRWWVEGAFTRTVRCWQGPTHVFYPLLPVSAHAHPEFRILDWGFLV